MKQAIYTGRAAKAIDRLAITEFGYSGLDLMTLAGQRAFQVLMEYCPAPQHVLVLCGSGNNGGDGYVVATCVLELGCRVTLVASGEPKTDDARTVAKSFVSAGGQVLQLGDSTEDSLATLKGRNDHFDVVVDALLGVGLKGAPKGGVAALVDIANTLQAIKLSIDVPTGVDADAGAVFQPCFRADYTISYIVRKIGLCTGPALNYCGHVHLESLGIGTEVIDRVDRCAKIIMPPSIEGRPSDSHKGRYGSVLIAGGDYGMLGAVLLAGKAALRCGSGKVRILSTQEHLDQAALFTPELMSSAFIAGETVLDESIDCIALGPGLGIEQWGKDLFEHVLSGQAPLVIDADGLNLLANAKGLDGYGKSWVLTPHPGEAARLLDCSTTEVQANRLSAVEEIAKRYHAVCVLKGPGTLVADPSGSVSLCSLGNPGMATAGMGDVLTGMIAGFIGQGMGARDSVGSAVWVHARTADRLVAAGDEHSLIASDIIDDLTNTFRELS